MRIGHQSTSGASDETKTKTISEQRIALSFCYKLRSKDNIFFILRRKEYQITKCVIILTKTWHVSWMNFINVML